MTIIRDGQRCGFIDTLTKNINSGTRFAVKNTKSCAPSRIRTSATSILISSGLLRLRDSRKWWEGQS